MERAIEQQVKESVKAEWSSFGFVDLVINHVHGTGGTPTQTPHIAVPAPAELCIEAPEVCILVGGGIAAGGAIFGHKAAEGAAESIIHTITEEEETDEGEAYNRERTEEEDCEAASSEERGKQLKREGEELLGRRHSKAGAERWQEWWKTLSKADRRLYKKFRGPPARSRF